MQWKGRNNMKLKIIITGSKVHGVGYRVMLVNKAISLGINNFNVFNTFLQGNQAVFAVIEGDEDVLGEFKDYVNNVKPEETRVDNISFEDYRNAFPPIERVMQAFQMEQWGKGIPILLKMLEKQDSVIERQDTTIGILKSVKEDTAAIRTDTKEIAAKLWEKYEELSKEIAQMKITLSKIEAKVFS
jgi:acylphosphatase